MHWCFMNECTKLCLLQGFFICALSTGALCVGAAVRSFSLVYKVAHICSYACCSSVFMWVIFSITPTFIGLRFNN